MDWYNLLTDKRSFTDYPSYEDKILYSEFEKDYSTIINSAIFRRLQDKAQVFPLESDDFVRTRLTHSLEVSSIAKSLGESIFRELKNKKVDAYFEYNSSKDICDILLCAGLIHDIGNPPFGHFGENAIRDWFKTNLSHLYYKDSRLSDFLNNQMINDLYQFEGNAQALRILAKNRYLGIADGLNLTYAVLNTIIKYPVNSLEIKKDKSNIKYKKMGYYYSENELFNEISSSTGSLNNRHPLTYILEAADDIAYKTSDIEDAIVKRSLSYGIIVNSLKEYKDKYIDNQDFEDKYNDMVKLLETYYVEEINSEESNPTLSSVQKWLSEIKKVFIKSATDGFANNYESIMNGSFKNDIFYETFGGVISRVLRDITENYIYKDKSKIKIELSGTTIIHFLLDRFVKAVLYYDSDLNNSLVNLKTMEIFSNFYKTSYMYHSKDKSENEKLYLRLLMVTDCVSGMTDGYIKKLYHELNGM